MSGASERSERRWELPLVALLAFAALLVLRRADLDTPYWWDAAAVYVPGSRWVAEHGFAALPGVFPSVLARGHTTLFYLVTAVPFRLFGPAPPIGHAVVLGFAVLGVAYTYRLGARLFGRPAGAVAAALLTVSPLWLTMSSQVLPEVPLAALTAASLYELARGRHGAAALFGVLIVLTKETGVACPLAITGALLLWGGRARSLRALRGPIAISLVPTLVLAAFFVWQRLAEGWWVLPYHADLFGQEHDYLAQGAGVFATMLVDQGRWVALIGALAIGGWRLRRAPETFAPFEAGPAGGAPPRWVVLSAIVLVFLANQGFFTQMWFLERYALAAHPGLVVLLAGALVPGAGLAAAPRLWVAGGVIVAAALAVALGSQYAGEGYASGETTFRYLHMIEAHRVVYRTLEAEPEPPLVLSAWPMTEELRDPALGWVSRPYETVGIRGYRDGSDTVARGRPIGAIVTAEGLGPHDDLVAEARRLGMRRRQRAAVEGAVVELWTP